MIYNQFEEITQITFETLIIGVDKYEIRVLAFSGLGFASKTCSKKWEGKEDLQLSKTKCVIT